MLIQISGVTHRFGERIVLRDWTSPSPSAGSV